MPVVDAWMQHPTLRHSADPIFDSLRRWTHASVPDQEVAVSDTVALMDAAGVDFALASAWYAPRNIMISNEEVHRFVVESKGRLVGVGSVDISKPMEAVAEVRRCVSEFGFKAMRVLPWLSPSICEGLFSAGRPRQKPRQPPCSRIAPMA